MIIIMTIGFWIACLGAGRLIGGEANGPILGLLILIIWHFLMMVFANPIKPKEV